MFFLKRPISLVLFISFIIPSYVTADVISANIATDIQEPVGTYDSSAPVLVNMFAKTVIDAGACTPTDYTGCTFNDVLNDINSTDNFKPEVKVHFQADDFLDDGLVSNAKIRQRGGASRSAPQKSFRIKLDSKDILWRGERRMQLVKSFYELSRIRNKLSFDLFADIPHLPSMRTHFVNLELEDQGVTQNLGLFTSIEHFGKEYLKRRGWDKDSRVYKTEHFYFQNRPAFALDATGNPVNVEEFEKLVEIKRGKSHFEFVAMVEAMNDDTVEFQTNIFNKYFNQDNYLTWFAVNILVNNIDTDAHNYYLYNPKNTEKFYFIPWDYDFAWGASVEEPDVSDEHRPRWWYSHAYWWGNNMHERFLKEPGNFALLKQAVTEIKNKYLTPEKIAAKRDAYYDVMFPILSTNPDWDFIYLSGSDPEKVATYNQVFAALSNNVEENYAKFLERADDPMPFYMDEPVFGTNNSISFDWDRSKSLSDQIIIYDLEIATTKEFTAGTIIRTVSNISTAHYTLQWTHPKGTYYFRVISRDAANPQNSWQVSYDSDLKYENNKTIYGVKEFYVSEDGGVTPPPNNNAVSNPVTDTLITVDGSDAEWNNLTLFASDADDINNSNIEVIDWQTVGMAHTDSKVYFLYKNNGPIDPANNSGSYIPWGWQAFIDTDNNPDTGFKFSSNIGAEYMIEGTVIQRYNGTGRNWNWSVVGVADGQFVSNKMELSFPRTWLGSPQALNIVFQGANEAYAGTTKDNYPDSVNTDLLSYSFGNDVTPPTNNAPVATGQNFTLMENTVVNTILSATDADGDVLSLIITQQPTQGTLSISGLNVAYTPTPNFTGTDSFKYKVNDGQVDSNVATISLNVVAEPPAPVIISNPVVSSGITINGLIADWSGLTLFTDDPDDITFDASNHINWLRAGLAHSNDTVYIVYENLGPINPTKVTGSSIVWGWQTYFDVDATANTGFKFNSEVGAEYLIEGNHVFQYAGDGNSWNWTLLGRTESKYTNNVMELSFPRAWFTALTDIKVAFFGNNQAFGGNSIDSYPEQGGFEYSFGVVGEFGVSTPIAEAQRQQSASPESHNPLLIELVSDAVNSNGSTAPTVNSNVNTSSDNSPAVTNVANQSDSKGGSLSWLLLFSSILLMRKRKLFLHL